MGEKHHENQVSKMFDFVLHELYKGYQVAFHSEPLHSKLNLNRNKNDLRQAKALGTKGYFYETNFDSWTKFKKLKLVLRELDLEDELLIKYL